MHDPNSSGGLSPSMVGRLESSVPEEEGKSGGGVGRLKLAAYTVTKPMVQLLGFSSLAPEQATIPLSGILT